MNPELTEKATEYIESIAKSLGVAAEHVYGLLVRQQIAEAISTLVITVIAIIALVTALLLVIKAYREFTGYDPFGYILAIAILSIVTLMVSLVGLFEGAESVMKLINPEYYAIQEIFDLLRGESE